jgi:hypothetical protein
VRATGGPDSLTDPAGTVERMTRWLVTRRGPNGEAYPTDVTAWLGYPTEYERIVGVLSQLPDGWTLDSAEADARHCREVIARRRYTAAYNRWHRTVIGRTDPLHPGKRYEHPGALEEWMPRVP